MEKLNCVLLIDDDESTNKLSYQIIKKLDFAKQIYVCYSGEEAMEFLKEFKVANYNESPELILIDIAMPKMDGFEFIEAFNSLDFSNSDRITSVILTSSSDLNDIRRAKKMGVNDYLIKPLTTGNMAQLLQSNKILA